MNSGTILVTGANGFIGGHVAGLLASTRSVVRHGRTGGDVAVDLTDPEPLVRWIAVHRPTAVVHTAAMATVAGAEREPGLARRINVAATERLAIAATEIGAHFIHLSTDQVFDGESAPYVESAATSPLSVYGETKAESERRLVALGRRVAICRVALCYGWSPAGDRTALEMIIRAAGRDGSIRLFEDEIRTPIAVDDVAAGIEKIVDSGASGTFHLAGRERLTRVAFGERVAAVFGLDLDSFARRSSRQDVPGPRRPYDVSLSIDETMLRLEWAPRPIDRMLEALRDSQKN